MKLGKKVLKNLDMILDGAPLYFKLESNNFGVKIIYENSDELLTLIIFYSMIKNQNK